MVTRTKEEILVSNSKAWSTLYNQCIRQSINRYGKKELVSTVQSCVKSVRFHTAFLQELKFTTTFNFICRIDFCKIDRKKIVLVLETHQGHYGIVFRSSTLSLPRPPRLKFCFNFEQHKRWSYKQQGRGFCASFKLPTLIKCDFNSKWSSLFWILSSRCF